MILVTGGFGFIGNEVVRQLASRFGNENIHVLDNFSRVAPDIEDLCDIAYSKIDIRDHEKANEIIKFLKPRTIIHLAALHFIPDCNSNPIETLEINVEATLNLVLSALKYNVNHFVFASSGAVYADYPDNIKEDFKCAPVDIYGYSKLYAEQLIQLYLGNSGVKVSICRFFNNYGPRETNPHIIPEIIEQLKDHSNYLDLGNIDSIRDYIHVEDTAKSILVVLENQKNKFETFNIGTGIGYSVRELIIKIGELLDSEIEIRIDDNRFRKIDKQVQIADISKLNRLDKIQIDMISGLTVLLEYENLLKK